MLFRNTLVYKERTNAHKKIFEKENEKYIWSREIPTLIRELDSIATYNQILHRFWTRPSSYYKEFLQDLESRKQTKQEKKETQ